ncbi:AlpA family phage regulatory protein [Pseudomonas gingeri]|uniref:AlpA family phage regulatory protein n=1 Tax=Pseudomonas gingeri TaxID=117681 RepID=UPI0015A06401|nr:AlpA family phage regulatory protein [Pseudomonas gingeri]NWA04868.1 AlpA family phage regulatory protein [Pseudomonas gingeri]NWA17163.1 AlpA family phage regulatory protein [Pseudomonas gingeri]NWA57820.1 AlpA family phage regulatory protein [Pseudomonas gingeri]NWA96649.1 AlpA family phage regulatory protein [Pseudomonas gingeri]NWB06238.1 AlpA family phage regulatory protein [Pseudomonas gingeri]
MATQARPIRISEQSHPAVEQPRRFIKLSEVKALTTFSTSDIYRSIAAGRFPKQGMLGPKSAVCIEAEVIAWCDSLVALRMEAA